ncbi:hypothetical protein B5X24_HaOG201827 [Helicoverpa armigera]|nr:hypothetical protein B5X24_HaOG201827 [Helicoverpa armigera]
MLEVGKGRMRGAGARSDVTRRARGVAPVPLATARSVTRDSRPKSSKHDHELPINLNDIQNPYKYNESLKYIQRLQKLQRKVVPEGGKKSNHVMVYCVPVTNEGCA